MGISGYLLWGSLDSGGLPGCGPASGCDIVLTSRWSSWFGVPVSLPALVLYAGLLAALSWRVKDPSPVIAAWRWLGLTAGAVAILGAAVWFTVLQLFVIRAICPFCMVAHACGVMVGVQLLRRAQAGSESGQLASNQGKTSAPAFRWALGAGAGAVVLLVAGQLLYEPPSYRVTGIDAATIRETGSPPGDPQEPESSVRELVAHPAQATRLLSVHDGLFVLDLNTAPVIGSPAAPTVVLHFFDYTCNHCRTLHTLLAEAHHALGDRLALVSLPVPLDMECNPILQRPMPAHVNACIYARIGLAIWRVQGAQLHAYDDWFFSFPRPPSPEAAQAEAGRLVGTNALAEALRDPWIGEYIAQSISLYHTNYLRYQRGTLPLLMVGTNLVSGIVRNTNQLYSVLGISP
jgi:uncharacterized membrane protein